MKTKRTMIITVVLALVLVPMLSLLGGCNKQAAAPTPTPAPAEKGPYAGVVITGSTIPVTQLQAKGFDFATGTDGKINGGFGTRNFWGTDKFIDVPGNPAPAEAAKYFTVPFTGADLTDAKKYIELQQKGQLPFTWANNDTGGFNVPALPADTNKVMVLDYIDNKNTWGENPYDRVGHGITPEWTQLLIDNELQPLVDRVKNRFPDCKFYFASFTPPSKDFGHADATKYPNAETRFTDKDEWAVNHIKSDFKAANAVLKKWCDKNGFGFCDLMQTALIGEDGWVKEEYIHSYGDGRQLSNAGVQIYGDAIMATMGLPKPKDVQPDWFK
jgi:hypothetical protein